jgi:hypothetical protein
MTSHSYTYTLDMSVSKILTYQLAALSVINEKIKHNTKYYNIISKVVPVLN